MELVSLNDIVEKNGKTVRENNMKKNHNIPIDTLVEIKYNNWHGDGACEKIHARLWVFSHNRDCDGTPLYGLAKSTRSSAEDAFGKNLINALVNGGMDEEGNRIIDFPHSVYLNSLVGHRGGFAEENLTPVEITDKLKEGYDSLEWN